VSNNVFFARPQGRPIFSPQIFLYKSLFKSSQKYAETKSDRVLQPTKTKYWTSNCKRIGLKSAEPYFTKSAEHFLQIGGTFFTNRREQFHQIGGKYSPNRRTELYTKSAEHAQNIGQMKWGPDMFSSSIIAMGAQ
jgi:hypothetical protein